MRYCHAAPLLTFLILFQSLMLRAQAPVPVISAVTNLASHAEGPVAAGQMVTIWGTGLGPADLIPHALEGEDKLATRLAGVEVRFDGTAAPLLYVSQNQAAAIIPREVAGAAVTAVTIEREGLLSEAFELAVAPAAVGVFTADSSGTGPVAALNADGSYNDAAHPAPRGSWVTFFATGAGDTDPPGSDGVLTRGAARLLAPVSVWIGLRESTVLYAGAAPGAAHGLTQANAGVPQDLPYRGPVSLTLQVGDSRSQRGAVVYVDGPAPPAPAAPTGLSAIPTSERSIQLAWRTSDDLAARFQIERRAEDGSAFQQIATVTAGTPTFVDDAVQPGSEYAYRVRAAGATGFSPYSSAARVLAGLAAAETPLVISQVYVNDIFGVRLYESHYVELKNVASAPISLDGLSLQVASGSYSWRAVPLSGLLEPGQHYLVAIPGSTTPGSLLPTPDAVGPEFISPGSLSSFSGYVVLVRGIEPLPTRWPTRDQMIDLFTYGSRGDIYHGRPFDGPTGEAAFLRRDNGCRNTENNGDDFMAAAPQLRNTGSPSSPCPAGARSPIIDAVRNAATLRAGPLSAAGLALIEGRRFTPGRMRVLVDGTSAPVYLLGPDRLLTSLPPGLPPYGTASLIVEADGLPSAPHAIELAPTAPGVFSRVSARLNASSPRNEGGVLNGPKAPATEGSLVTVSLTGLGVEGAAVSAMLGGQAVQIAAVAPAPGDLEGLWELTLRVPGGLRGMQPVRIRAGTAESPPVYLQVVSEPTQHDDFDVLRIASHDLVYDPFREVLYVSDGTGEVTVVDPRTRSVVGSIACGGRPQHLAVSAGGRYLWLAAGLDDSWSLERIDLETRELEFSITERDLRADESGLGRGILTMRPHPNDEELLAVATHGDGGVRTPLLVVNGPNRLPGVGPKAENIAFLDDGSFWASGLRLEVGPNGPEVIGSRAHFDATEVHLAFENQVLDDQNVLRNPANLARTGFLGIGIAFHSRDYAVYRPDDGLVYAGGGFGGLQNYGIQAFDPRRMVPVGEFVFFFHEEDQKRPRVSSIPGRFVSIGAEGFATVFVAEPGQEDRGGVYFFPPSIIEYRPGPPVPAPQPQDGSIRRIPLPAYDAAVDPLGGKIYLAVPSFVGSLGSTILPFDPVSGRFDDPVWAGSDPRASTITPDGRYLYVHLAGARSVQRYRLPQLALDQEFLLETRPGVTTNATALLNIPNEPSSTITVERAGFGLVTSSAGVAIYDDGVARPQVALSCPECPDTGVYPNSSRFSPSGSHLFAINNQDSSFTFSRWLVGPDGFTPETSKRGLSAGFSARLDCGQDVCVTSSGVLFDPIGMERIRVFGDDPLDTSHGSFNSNSLVVLDAANNRVLFLVSGDLRAYELSTGVLRGTLSDVSHGRNMQMLPSGDIIILGAEGVVLIPAAQLP